MLETEKDEVKSRLSSNGEIVIDIELQSPVICNADGSRKSSPWLRGDRARREYGTGSSNTCLRCLRPLDDRFPIPEDNMGKVMSPLRARGGRKRACSAKDETFST